MTFELDMTYTEDRFWLMVCGATYRGGIVTVKGGVRTWTPSVQSGHGVCVSLPDYDTIDHPASFADFDTKDMIKVMFLYEAISGVMDTHQRGREIYPFNKRKVGRTCDLCGDIGGQMVDLAKCGHSMCLKCAAGWHKSRCVAGKFPNCPFCRADYSFGDY